MTTTSQGALRVGFIGLGAIGYPMARRIAQRFPTTVWNRTAARSEQLRGEAGVDVAADAAALAARVDVVVTCLPTSREVAEVVEGMEDGGGLRRGQMVVDCTSGDPSASRDLAGMLAPRGVTFIDAPVSGGVSGAEQGTLTVMVGGEAAALERAQPVLAAFGRRIVHCGPVGAGHAVKAVNQALLAVNIAAAGEGLAALVKLGVPAGVALDVLNASSGRSNVTENLIPERVVTRAWPRTFRLALLEKDVGIAAQLVDQAGVPGPVTAATRAFMQEARRALGEAADHVEAIRLIEQRAGVEIR
jgi:3-hydroxyisobutyrate dehydrogenase